MIKPNWSLFRSKFNENPQDNFQWFCYLLFCKEYNKPFGINRFKNHSSIETDPITHDKEIIGWQAKFYSGSLSIHKDEILDTITRAKRDYLNLTKILFYTNEEWGQNKGKKPKGLIDIEKKEKELKIKIDWRLSSYFESEFVIITNAQISKYFFTNDQSIFDIIERQTKHTESLLEEIQTKIEYNNKSIEIDRDNFLKKINEIPNNIILLTGGSGVGKTALLKKYYNQTNKEIPFYLFKSTEFELRNLTELLNGFDFTDFLNAHADFSKKLFIIDSAEKLLDLSNTAPLKEALIQLNSNNWKIIFTARSNYLEDLNYQFFEIYNIHPYRINILDLSQTQLVKLSMEYSFKIPKDDKLVDLIRNPFHLSEYLKFITKDEEIDFIGFKNKIWNRHIIKSTPERELYLLKVAFERANTGRFSINLDFKNETISSELINDGILGYESAGYFITHDIYEEWALEKIIEGEFQNKQNILDFFSKIGGSLPIRRSFRKWISDGLLLKNQNINRFIEEIFLRDDINSFWKDEIIVSILLSEYSKYFFKYFEKTLLDINNGLLKKIAFILRLSCKEIDDDIVKDLKISSSSLFQFKYVFTKPKGPGWINLISLIYGNMSIISIDSIKWILPIIHDWNQKSKEGETTRYSSILGLYIYALLKKGRVSAHGENNQNLIQSIIFGSLEIKSELQTIFNEILQNRWINHQDPYFNLSKYILKEFDGIFVAKSLPETVLKLAELFWFTVKDKKTEYYYQGIEIETYFGLSTKHDYFPSSAFQTPTYWLLQFYPSTIDYIIKFVNKSTKTYVESKFDASIKEIEIIFDNGIRKKQFISNCLWNIYRGTSSPVSPCLLQSIHMALEKYLLELGSKEDTKKLEAVLLKLLLESESASITAVVASIVLAYPDKLFNIAQVLFKTKEFFFYDNQRYSSDQTARMLYSIGAGLNFRNKVYQDERIKTCDDKHRKMSLENIFLYYQYFKNEDVKIEEAQEHNKILWGILDNYYSELTDESQETDDIKTWRLYLARMDRRKLNAKLERTKGGILLSLNPNIDPALNEFREKASAEINEFYKHSPLKIWSDYRFNNNKEFKQYKKYENNPAAVLKEVKEIIKELNNPDREKHYSVNYSIPAYSCAVLVRDFFDRIPKKDKLFCKKIILQTTTISTHAKYSYQVSDGIKPAISVLPILFMEYPKERDKIKISLLFNLFNETPIDMAHNRFNIFAIASIRKLWKTNFVDAQSILLGYLILKPIFVSTKRLCSVYDSKTGSYEINNNSFIESFIKENEIILNKIIENKISFVDIGKIEEIDLYILNTAFQLILFNIDNIDYKKLAKKIIDIFISKLLGDDDKIEYTLKINFLETFSNYIFGLNINEIEYFIQPVFDNFKNTEAIADLFEQLILFEDKINQPDKFWFIWNYFKSKIIELCKKDSDKYHTNEIIKSYLLASAFWKESAKEWHTLKIENDTFFMEISHEIGNYPPVFYSITKLLSGIGNIYLEKGIFWISKIISGNSTLIENETDNNTIYYLENISRFYIYKNREYIKRTSDIKNDLLQVLNYLIKQGSVIGYMLREFII